MHATRKQVCSMEPGIVEFSSAGRASRVVFSLPEWITHLPRASYRGPRSNWWQYHTTSHLQCEEVLWGGRSHEAGTFTKHYHKGNGQRGGNHSQESFPLAGFVHEHCFVHRHLSHPQSKIGCSKNHFSNQNKMKPTSLMHWVTIKGRRTGISKYSWQTSPPLINMQCIYFDGKKKQYIWRMKCFISKLLCLFMLPLS